MRTKFLLITFFIASFLAGADLPCQAFGQTIPLDAHESIDLPINNGEAFAVYINQKNLWIVANSASRITTESLRKPDSHFIKDVKKISSTQAAIFDITLNENLAANIVKSQTGTLQIILQKNSDKLTQYLFPTITTNELKQYLISIGVPTAKQIISFTDPETGHDMKVIPVSDPGTGVSPARSFVEFNLLKSAQGVAIEKISDNITVLLNKGSIDIAAANGLTISADITQQIRNAEAEAAAANTPPTLYPYARWKLPDDKDFVPVTEKLFQDIAYGTPESSNKARLRLVDIYLAQGLFAEALGVSNDILRKSYKFYKTNKVASLRGAAYFFMYRIADAERDFSSPELAGDKEAEMWRDLCKEMLGEEGGGFNFTANYDHYIRNYPPAFIQKLAIITADFSINRKEYDSANAILDILVRDNLDEPIKKYIDYMHAEIYSETRNEEEAAKIWEQQIADIDTPLIRARAEFSMINMLLRQERITPEKAIKRLEKLRIVWRGDNLELNVLTLLGNLYLEDKQYSKALHTMRDIVLYYPELPQALTTARKMEEVFINLYNKGGADSMPPLEALSLFYEFRDLVPADKDGDMMIRNLADRLAGIDLLDRAAMLLNHQVQNRLQGNERSRVAAKLAQIYLENHKPKEALDILKTTGYGELPSDLQLLRLRLTAQALAQQDRSDKAIDVLSSDNSAEGNLLRLKIYWDNKDWPNVVSTAEEILGNRNDPSAPLNPGESSVLLKLATAYVYEHDTGQIQYLRDYFTPLLKDNPDKDSFLFITSESGTIDYENLANLDTDISEVKSFIEKSKEQAEKKPN